MRFRLSIIFYKLISVMIFSITASTIAYAQSITVAIAIPFFDDREETSRMRVDHSDWQELLDTYLVDTHESGINRFSYNQVTTGDKLKLQRYLEYLQSFEPRQFNSNEQKSFWVNLFNSMAVFIVLNEDDDELVSIREIRSGFLTAGPWKLNSLNVVQQNLTLDDIENGILRPILNDNRINYVIQHASLGDANLQKIAFTGENIEGLLEQAAKDFINSPRAVSIVGGKLLLSEIYSRYAIDFADNFGGLIDYLKKYINPEMAAQLERFTEAEYVYDWDLNQP